jgi:outer membrane immunogenic protein
MRKLLIGSVAVMAMLAAPAMAGDLQTAKGKPLYMQAPVYSWTGWYVGGNVGYSWGRSESDFSFANGAGAVAFVGSDSANLDGVIGGGQVGFNRQIYNYVWGFETDFQGSAQKGSSGATCAGGTAGVTPLTLVNSACAPGHIGDTRPFDVAAFPVSIGVNQELEWFGTVRGRFGYLVTPTILFYGTGGLAYGRVNTTATVNGINVIGQNGTNPFDLSAGAAISSSSAFKAGWTLGAGVEGQLGGNWSAKVEYLYIDLGTVSGAFATPIVSPSGSTLVARYSSHITDNILRVGVNYNFSAAP